MPVDYSRNKLGPTVPKVTLDLTKRESVKVTKQLIATGSIQVATAAVPCGTARRAREIFIPGGPRPLRSDFSPYGLPRPSGLDRVRVKMFTAMSMKYCFRPMIVNPKSILNLDVL